MRLHSDVMPPVQQRVLERVGPIVKAEGFYLAGGTAVAIHLGHRRSVDFDWFTSEPLDAGMRLISVLRRENVDVDLTAIDRGVVYGEAEGVRLSFFEYAYPLVRPLVRWPGFGCALASLDDLACMKLSAVSSRGARKDFVDVYALGCSGLSLTDMLASYRQKYGAADVGHVLFSLTYFDDADAEEMPEMLWEVSWDEIKWTIGRWTREQAG